MCKRHISIQFSSQFWDSIFLHISHHACIWKSVVSFNHTTSVDLFLLR
jgi:hypothetical protein